MKSPNLQLQLSFSLVWLSFLRDDLVICRIFQKSRGEKNNPCTQINNSYFLKSLPPSFPPLLEPSTLHSPPKTLSNQLVLQESNLNTQNLIHFPTTLQSISSPTKPCIRKSLSHQFLLKEPPILKQCKMGNSVSFISNQVDTVQNHCTYGMCLGGFGLSASLAAHDLSSSISVDWTGFQMDDDGSGLGELGL